MVLGDGEEQVRIPGVELHLRRRGDGEEEVRRREGVRKGVRRRRGGGEEELGRG